MENVWRVFHLLVQCFLNYQIAHSLLEFSQILNLKSLSQSSYNSVFAHGLYLGQ